MLRALIWATVSVLFAGGSLAAPSRHVSLETPRFERPAPAGDWSLDGLLSLMGEEATAEEILVARGGRGHNRKANRNVNRNVNHNVNRNVNVHHGGGYGGGGGWDDDDNAAGAALLGAAVGMGVGAIIANDKNNN